MSVDRFWETLPAPWQACLEMAWEAFCAGTIPIGAAITDADGTVIARGRNHIFDEIPQSGTRVYANEIAHAEIDAFNQLFKLDNTQRDLHACTLYSTTEPCPMCMGTLYMSGVRNLQYASRDPWAGSVNMLGTTEYLSRKKFTVVHPSDPALELLIASLSTERDLSIYHYDIYKPGGFYARLNEGMPGSLEAGMHLYETKILACLLESKASAAEMVNTVYPLMESFVRQ